MRVCIMCQYPSCSGSALCGLCSQTFFVTPTRSALRISRQNKDINTTLTHLEPIEDSGSIEVIVKLRSRSTFLGKVFNLLKRKGN